MIQSTHSWLSHRPEGPSMVEEVPGPRLASQCLLPRDAGVSGHAGPMFSKPLGESGWCLQSP
jgi:hypothetical protein